MIFPAKPSAVAGRFDFRAKVGGGLSGIGLGCGLLFGVLVALASLVRAAEPAPSATVEAIPAPPGGVRPLTMELDGRWIGDGIAYGPYRRGQSPEGPLPNDAETLEDLRILCRHWNLIRMYGASAEAERVLRLIREHGLPLRLVLGAWIGRDTGPEARAANRRQVETAIRLANSYRDLVVAVNVGNETQVSWSWQPCDRAVLIGFIREVRSAIAQPVTTADDHDFWNKPEARAVAAEVDFIMLHAYALWNGRQLDEAIRWTAGVYDEIRRLYPDRPVIIGETGWATSRVLDRPGPDGESARMKAETSLAAQENYLRQHRRWVRENQVVTLLFEAFDETWKGAGPAGDPREAEKNWGLFTVDRQPKASFLALMRECEPAVVLLHEKRPLVIGHRGYAAAAPENTLPSFRLAQLAGADLVELDYHVSRDGVPVVIHDPTLDRTTDAVARWGGRDLRVADRSAAELATLDAGAWFDARFAGTRLPRLSEAVAAIAPPAVVLIERKGGDAAGCARFLREHGLVNRVVVQSFDWEFLGALHALVPEQVLGALGPRDHRDGRRLTAAEQALDATWLTQAAATGASVVVWSRAVTADAVRLAHDQGLKVWVYTIDDPAAAQTLLAFGVDGIITNNPGLIWKAIATRPQP